MAKGDSLADTFVTVNGVKLHCVSRGQGPLMLFLHGFPEFWYAWRKQLEFFGKDYYAVAPDMRGYNVSGKPKSIKDYYMPNLIADVKGLIDELGGGKAVLVAHDWGGAVAWKFAAKYPQCLQKLIIINSPHPTTFLRELKTNPTQRKASSYMLLFGSGLGEPALRRNNFERLREAVFEKSADPSVYSNIDRETYLDAWSQPGALAGGLNYYRAFVAQMLERLFQSGNSWGSDDYKVSVPTMVIWGMKDTALLPGNLNGLENLVPDLEIKQIADGTHWVIHEQPDLINQYISQFVEGVSVKI